MAINRADVAPAETAEGQAGTALGLEPGLFRGHFVDSAHRVGLALPAGSVSLASHLLAASEAVGRAGRLVAGLASAAGRTGRRGVIAMGRNLSVRQFRSR